MSRRPIYFDTETTGVKPDRDRIVEIAALDASDNRTFCSLINPGCPIPAEASAIHRITDEMVASAPLLSEVASSFIEFCGSDAILIAHNNDQFDKLFLEWEFKRAGIPMPPWIFLDTLKWSRKYRYDLPRHTLQYLREVYGIAPNQAHRALDDVQVLHQIFSQMIGDLPLETVCSLIGQKQQVAKMPFGKHQGKPLSEVPKSYVRWLQENSVFDKPENQDLKEAFVLVGALEKTL